MSCKLTSKLCLMYINNAFIEPHLNYCAAWWDNACEFCMSCLRTLQKGNIKLVNGTSYLKHYKPLAKNLNTLIVADTF